MAKSKNESNNKNSGTLLTEKVGTQYFVMGVITLMYLQSKDYIC